MKGKTVPPPSLEQRVAALERAFAALKLQRGKEGHEKDWRRTIGVFTDNPEMKELFAKAIELREADRRKARRRQPRKRPAQS